LRITCRRWFIVILCCLLGVVPQFNQQVTALGTGLGVSGSFANGVFKMIPGETLNHSATTVTFFNTTASDIMVKLSGDGPLNTVFFFEQTIHIIPAKSQLTLAVSFRLNQDIAPGMYPISIRADIISNSEGIALSGFAQLNASVKVYGEAGQIRVFVKDLRDQPFPAALQLFRLESGVLIPVTQSESGSLDERLVPGNYRVTATYLGFEVASQDFELKDNDELVITLIAKTVLITLFMAGAKRDQNDRIQSIELIYTIRNLIDTEPSVDLSLSVIRQDKFLEEVSLMTLPTLQNGETSGRFTYYPKDGFISADYGFTLIVRAQDDLILAISQMQTLTISVKQDFDPWPWVISVLGFILLIVLAKRRRHSDRPNA
jgi:hypothetical protein